MLRADHMALRSCQVIEECPTDTIIHEFGFGFWVLGSHGFCIDGDAIATLAAPERCFNG